MYTKMVQYARTFLEGLFLVCFPAPPERIRGTGPSAVKRKSRSKSLAIKVKPRLYYDKAGLVIG